MEALNEIAAAHKLFVIEDAAEAHGAEVDGRKAGSLGNVGTFSFYGNKVITTGEGGMLTTDDDDLAARLRFLKDHGMSTERRYFHTELAFNYRMTNLQAALGFAQLSQIENFVEKKRTIFNWYKRGLGNLPGISLNVEREGYRNIFWMTNIVLDPESPLSRETLCAELRKEGIDSRPFFVPMSELPHLAGFRQTGTQNNGLSVSAQVSKLGFSLPSGCQLNEEQVGRVVQTLRKLVG